MAYVSSVSDFWISTNALAIGLNALDNPEYLQASVLSGSVVMAYKEGLIGYDSAHNYKKWALEAYNNFFSNSAKKFVYARLTRNADIPKALITYTDEMRSMDGQKMDTDGQYDGTEDEEYYYIYLGTLSASVTDDGVTVMREWTDGFLVGKLGTDQFIREDEEGDWRKMFRLNSITDFIDVLKTMSSAIINTLTVNTKFIFRGKEITNIQRDDDKDKNGNEDSPSDTVLPTTKYVAERCLSSINDDEAAGLIKLLKGLKSKKDIEIGDFVTGLLGSGIRLSESGYAEMTGLSLREFLEVPELRFNRVDVVSGELWNAVAFGTIESVDIENQIATLHLIDGELRGVHLQDFCRGLFHNLEGNSTTSVKDSSGFDTLAGFSTSYFTPTELLDDGVSFKYALKPGTTVHPCASMKFAVYGNPVDTSRQVSAYDTRTYKRYLRGVDTWKITTDNIAMQFGDCSGLTIGGVDMSGYSAYLNNVYITGVIKWIEDNIDKFKGKDAYIVELSSYYAIVNVNSKGQIDDSIYDLVNIVSGTNYAYTGTSQIVQKKYKIQTKVQVATQSSTLEYVESDPHEGQYSLSIVASGCTWKKYGDYLTVKSISADLATLEITVNLEGKASILKTFQVKRVYDGQDASLPEYLLEWNNNLTLIGDKYVVSPTMFSGTKDSNGKLTGVAMGRDCITVNGVKRTGIFALVEDKIVFQLDPISKVYKFTGDIYATGDSEFGGKLKATSGTFTSLNCIDGDGNVVGQITFGTDGSMNFNGDVNLNVWGSKKGNLSCKRVTCDTLVYASKAILLIEGTTGYYYPDGLNNTLTREMFTLPTDVISGGITIYYIPVGGYPASIVLLKTTSAYKFTFTTAMGREIMVANINNNQSNYIYSNGTPVEFKGGEMATCLIVGNLLTPSVAQNVVGSGVLIGAFRDNNW